MQKNILNSRRRKKQILKEQTPISMKGLLEAVSRIAKKHGQYFCTARLEMSVVDTAGTIRYEFWVYINGASYFKGSTPEEAIKALKAHYNKPKEASIADVLV